MSSKLPSNVTRMGDATVIRDEDASNPVAVRFDHVTKQYKLFKNDKLRLLSTFSKRIPHDTVNASDDLSFTVNRGESLALLGDNGAGKSTALKMITGVCFPTSGTVEVHGRVSALLELSAGFDMKLSGMENIDMRCQLWGLSKEESKELIPEIVEFSELGKYIDQPMRTYSSGMRARLGFAFVSSIRPDILVVDEALSVGDRKFAKEVPRAGQQHHRQRERDRAVRHPLDRHREGVLPQGHRHPEGQSHVQRWHRGGRRLLHRLVTLRPFR